VAGVEHVAAHDDRPSVLTAARSRPLRVLVCGSRDWRDWRTIDARVRALPNGSTVIHGAARGADLLAAGAAVRFGYGVQAFPANWKHYGKAAGIIRTLAMFDSGIDLVTAFQRGGSRGTQFGIDEARRRGIPVEVFTA
jgi:hypothetical protein